MMTIRIYVQSISVVLVMETADIVLCGKEESFVAIAECKNSSIGITDAGRNQLKSYLNATGTRFDILAASVNSDDWIFAENLGGNKFRQIKRPYFEKHVFDPPAIEWTQQNVRKWKSIAQIAISFLLVIVLSLIVLLVRDAASPPSTNGFINRDNLYQVVRIIDGDTVELEYEGALTSVQLIGVNAPETIHPSKPEEPYGGEATAFLQKLLLYKFVYFEFGRNERDRYDRLLAYVYRDSDDLFVNVELIREGYGQTDDRFPFKYMKLFQYHESQARAARKRLWSR